MENPIYLRTNHRNLGLSHVRVGDRDYVGSLAGIAGEVEHCHATGQVSGHDVVGGLVGSGRGSDHIRSSYAADRVSGTGHGIGGSDLHHPPGGRVSLRPVITAGLRYPKVEVEVGTGLSPSETAACRDSSPVERA